MNVATEECKPESYVGCPAPTVDLPECEGGWEIGNGTAVCATQVPDASLAVTGSDGASLAIGVVLGLAVGFTGVLLMQQSRRRERARRNREQWRRAMDAEQATLAADRAHYDPENPQR